MRTEDSIRECFEKHEELLVTGNYRKVFVDIMRLTVMFDLSDEAMKALLTHAAFTRDNPGKE